MQRTKQELDAMLSVQERVLSCSKLSDLKYGLLNPAQDYLDAATSCFLQLSANDAGEIALRTSVSNNVSQRGHISYVNSHFRNDPAVLAARRNKGAQPYVFCTAEVSDYALFTNSAMYHDFLRPNHIHHILVLAVRPQPGDKEILILGFHRPKGDRPFGSGEKGKLQELGLALASSLRNISLQSQLSLQERAVAEYSRISPEHGLLFFDQNMTLLYGNDTGLEHASLSGGKGETRLQRIAKACASASRNGSENGPIAVDFSEAEDVTAKISVFNDVNGDPIYSMHTNRRITEAIFITRCKETELSPREVEIARTLASGLSNSEIARRLNISYRTVENHLRSIYSKVGVNRRTQLISRLNDLG